MVLVSFCRCLMIFRYFYGPLGESYTILQQPFRFLFCSKKNHRQQGSAWKQSLLAASADFVDLFQHGQRGSPGSTVAALEGSRNPKSNLLSVFVASPRLQELLPKNGGCVGFSWVSGGIGFFCGQITCTSLGLT